MMRRLTVLAWLIMQPVAALPAGYPDGLTGDDIRGLVAVAMVQAGRTGRPLLSQWRSFPPCDTRPSVVPDAQWASVTLKCAAPQAWQRTVRIGAAQDAPNVVAAPVVTLRAALPKGTVLTRAHLDQRPARPDEAGAALRDPDRALGRRLRVTLAEGQVLQARHLETDHVVKTGDSVVLTIEAAGMSVLAEGEALADGQLGETVQVRSLSSGRVLTGNVVGKRKVAIRPKLD